jgi:heme ABC exporter ATP-binding subunit CcmA
VGQAVSTASGTQPAISAEHLSKDFHHSAVLRDVTFSVGAGECFALFGANGAGKTTLLRILATIQRPSGGKFFLGGHDGMKQREEARRLLFLIAHGSHHYDELSAAENLDFALRLRGLMPGAEDCGAVLERVGLARFADAKVRTFSSGMKKRLAFAKAMLIRPPVLLLDEPYAALDETGMETVNAFIKERAEAGGAVFMTTHNRQMTAQVANRVGVMARGRIDEIGVDGMLKRDELF